METSAHQLLCLGELSQEVRRDTWRRPDEGDNVNWDHVDDNIVGVNLNANQDHVDVDPDKNGKWENHLGGSFLDASISMVIVMI